MPDLCADRLDYFLKDIIIFKIRSFSEAQGFIENLAVKNNEIVFSNKEKAKDAGIAYMECIEKIWVSPLQALSYQLLTDTMKIGIKMDFYRKATL